MGDAPEDFPPWQTVYLWFRRFVRRFMFQTIHDVALMLDRERVGREASPTGGVVDSQSVKAPEAKTRGYDAGKKIVGRKRHIAVDTDGRLLMVNLTPADMSDSAGAQMILDGRDGAALVLDTIRKRFPWLELVWADAGYNARQVKDAVARSPGLRLESSSEPTTSKASSCCPVDGSSREPSHGS